MGGIRTLSEGFIEDWENTGNIVAEVSLREVAANEFNLNPRLYLSETDLYKTKIGDVMVKPRQYLYDTNSPKVLLRDMLNYGEA
jgi:hypothetical protein